MKNTRRRRQRKQKGGGIFLQTMKIMQTMRENSSRRLKSFKFSFKNPIKRRRKTNNPALESVATEVSNPLVQKEEEGMSTDSINPVETSVLQEGPQAGLQAGPQAGLQEGPQAGLQAGPQAGLQAGPQAGLQEGPQAGLQAGPPANKVNGANQSDEMTDKVSGETSVPPAGEVRDPYRPSGGRRRVTRGRKRVKRRSKRRKNRTNCTPR